MLDLTFNQSQQSKTTTQVGPAIVGVPQMPQAFPLTPARTPAPIEPLRPVIAPAGDQNVKYAAVVLVVVACIAGLVASYLIAQNKGEAELQSMAFAEIQQQQKTGETATKLARIQTVSNQLEILSKVLNNSEPWSDVLTAFTSLVPGSVKLTGSSFSGTQVRVEGVGKSFDDVATFMAALDQSDRFEDVSLTGSALQESTEGTSVTFSLNATYAVPTKQSEEQAL